MRKIVPFIILFLLIITCSLTFADYTNVGSENNTYRLTDTSAYFNTGLQPTLYSKSMTKITSMPVRFTDSNGDHVAILDGYTLKMYSTNLLTTYATINIPAIGSTTNSQPYAYDINGDGNQEIIFLNRLTTGVGNQIQVIIANSTGYHSLIYISPTLTPAGGGSQVHSEPMTVACMNVEECIGLLKSTDTVQYGDGVYAFGFNDSNLVNGTWATYGGYGFQGQNWHRCIEDTPPYSISVQDYTNSGTKKYMIATNFNQYGTGATCLGQGKPSQFTTNSFSGNCPDNTLICQAISQLDQNSANLTPYTIATGGITGSFNNTYVTEANIDGSMADGLEYILTGVQKGNYLQFSSYYNTLTKINDYPSYFLNPYAILGVNGATPAFMANVFQNSIPYSDFCTIAFMQNDSDWRTVNQFLNPQFVAELVCASETKSSSILDPNAREFFITNENLPFVNCESNDLNCVAYSSELENKAIGYARTDSTGSQGSASGQSQNGVSYSEIVSPYGILAIDYGDVYASTSAFPYNHMAPVIYNPFASIGTSYTGIPQEGQLSLTLAHFNPNSPNSVMIGSSNTTLYSVNDGFLNTPAQFTSIYFNPCYNLSWAYNTTFRLGLTANNTDGTHGDVFYNITFLKGSPNETGTGSWVQYPENLQLTLDNVANFSTETTTGILEFQVKNIYNTTPYNTLDYSIVINGVGLNGTSFNDNQPCTQNFAITTTTLSCIGNACPATTTTSTTLSIVNQWTPLIDFLGIGKTVFWLILMSVFAGMIIYAGFTNHINGSAIVILTVIAEVILLVMGWVLAFISTGIILVIVILASLVVGAFIAKTVTGTQSGGS